MLICRSVDRVQISIATVVLYFRFTLVLGQWHLIYNTSMYIYQSEITSNIRDAFPLPITDEALQAVHSSNWFSSFDLAQGYL